MTDITEVICPEPDEIIDISESGNISNIGNKVTIKDTKESPKVSLKTSKLSKQQRENILAKNRVGIVDENYYVVINKNGVENVRQRKTKLSTEEVSIMNKSNASSNAQQRVDSNASSNAQQQVDAPIQVHESKERSQKQSEDDRSLFAMMYQQSQDIGYLKAKLEEQDRKSKKLKSKIKTKYIKRSALESESDEPEVDEQIGDPNDLQSEDHKSEPQDSVQVPFENDNWRSPEGLNRLFNRK